MTNYHLNLYKKYGGLLAGILTVILGLFVSCSKDNGLSGPPVITKVTLLDAAKQDSAFTKALPGTLILITGQNLGGVINVTFNGMKAYANPTYNTDTHIILTIPSNTPTEGNDPNVPNLIKVITTHGEASYSFIIDIPPPSIGSVSNENALPGDSLIVYGSSLFLIDKILLPGGREITEYITNESGTRIAFIMPNLGTDTGRIIIQAKYGNATSDGPLNDYASGDVISNLTNNGETGEPPVFNWSWWGANRTNDPALFPGTRGSYLQNIFGGVGANDGGWWNGNRSGNFDPVALFPTSVLTKEASQYALKFEINTREPWTAGINVLRFNDKYAFRYQPWLTAENKTFDTKNKWQTVTVKLSDFKLTADGIEGTGASAVVMSDLLQADAKVLFGYRIITEADPVDVYNTAYDNFRIIKIK
jgi:hypothetical protein